MAARCVRQRDDVGLQNDAKPRRMHSDTHSVRQDRMVGNAFVHDVAVGVNRNTIPAAMMTNRLEDCKSHVVGTPSRHRGDYVGRRGRGRANGLRQERDPHNGESSHIQNGLENKASERVVHMAGETIGLGLYPRLMTILPVTEDLDPHLRSVGWVMRLVEEVYDSRRRAEQASFAAQEDHFNLDAGNRRHASFPAFAYKHLMNRHGIKLVVRSVCLDLVCNVHIHRRRHPEIEIFARFLEEFYGQKELLFFLDMRAELQRVTRVCARRRKAVTQTVWMTHADCVRVAKGVFLDTATLYFRDLIDTVEGQMTAPPRPTDTRHISLSDFLYLAMVCFTSPEEPSERHRRNLGSRGDRPRTRDISGNSIDAIGVSSGKQQSRGYSAEGTEGRISADRSPSTPLGDRRIQQQFYRDNEDNTSTAERTGEGMPISEFFGLEQSEERSTVTDDRRPNRLESPCWRGSEVDCRGDNTAYRGANGAVDRPWTGKVVPRTFEEPPESLIRDAQNSINAFFSKRSEEVGISSLKNGRRCTNSPTTMSTIVPGSQTAVLHVESDLLERTENRYVTPTGTGRAIHCSTPAISLPERTICSPLERNEHTIRERSGFSSGGSRRGITNENKEIMAKVQLPSPARHQSQEEYPSNRSIENREVTKTSGSGRLDLLSNHGDGGDTSAVRRNELRERPGPRTTAAHEGGNCSRVTPEAEVQQASRSEGAQAPTDADLISVGEKSSSTYASAEDGEGIIVDDEHSIAAKTLVRTTDPRLNELLANGPPRLLPQPMQQQQLEPPKPPRSASTPVPQIPHAASVLAEPQLTAVLPCPPVEVASRHRMDIALSSLIGKQKMSQSDRVRSPSGVGNDGRRGEAVGFRRRNTKGGGREGGHHVSAPAPAPAGAAVRQTIPGAPAKENAGFLESRWRQAAFARDHLTSTIESGEDAPDLPTEDDNALEIRTDVLAAATEWFAAFERRFLPCLAADSGAVATRMKAREDGTKREGEGFLPRPIARVLSEEIIRILALRRRDLHAVARDSPELLRVAVAEAFWMLDSTVSNAAAHSLALSNMGRLLEERGRWDEALLCFQEASLADTASAGARCLRAANLYRRGDLEGAAYYFEGALARDESLWTAWHGLGHTKAAQGKHEDTVEAISRWLTGDVGADRHLKAQGLVQVGDAQKALGKDEQARRSYELAISTDEGCSDARYKLSGLLRDREGPRADAAAALRRGPEMDRTRPP